MIWMHILRRAVPFFLLTSVYLARLHSSFLIFSHETSCFLSLLIKTWKSITTYFRKLSVYSNTINSTDRYKVSSARTQAVLAQGVYQWIVTFISRRWGMHRLVNKDNRCEGNGYGLKCNDYIGSPGKVKFEQILRDVGGGGPLRALRTLEPL